MAIAGAETSQLSMKDARFKTAGFLSLFNAVLLFPMVIAAILAVHKMLVSLLLFIGTPLSVISCLIAVYVLLQLKRLLIERYYIHNMNSIIIALIFCVIISCVRDVLMAMFMLMFPDPDLIKFLDLISGISLLLLAGVVGLIFGVRLLKVHEESSGLLRTYSIILIIGSACFISFFLFPIGLFLAMANDIVLGIIFLKEAGTEPQVEFV